MWNKAKKIILVLAAWLFFVGLYQTTKGLPADIDFTSRVFRVKPENVELLFDLTYEDLDGQVVREQEIFDEMLSLINNAEEYILIDMFLFNSYGMAADSIHRQISREVTDALIAGRAENPDLRVDLITDPINTVYGGDKSEQLRDLRMAGVNVIITDLDALRDSNPVYSAWWRTFIGWFGNSERRGLLPHPFSKEDDKVTLRSYLAMLNFKANHRKVMVADSGDSMVSIIGSANIHDASSAHSNAAARITGDFWQSIYDSESAVAKMSGAALQEAPNIVETDIDQEAGNRVAARLITENKIKDELLALLEGRGGGDRIDLAQFYLSDRNVIQKLLQAAAGGAEVRIILDPNKDAFGYKKNGLPNRAVAAELAGESGGQIGIRWYDTHGEQFHTKMAAVYPSGNDPASIILGSANFTRRNLDNYNLETDVILTAPADSLLAGQSQRYFDKIWHNQDDYYTVSYEAYKDETGGRYWLYRLQEFTGMCSY